MNQPPFREGDFVWSAFPERENPARPGPQQLAYVLAVSGVATTGGEQEFTATMAYTTSQPWPYPTRPRGVFVFDREEAASFGQSKAFVMDLRRLAWVPITPEWFPHLDQPNQGVTGRMPKRQRQTYEQAATELLTRYPDSVERLGPLWRR